MRASLLSAVPYLRKLTAIVAGVVATTLASSDRWRDRIRVGQMSSAR
jgi:hypothetical protein